MRVPNKESIMAMAAEPRPISPLNVYADLVRIGQGETALTDRLVAARARVDQFFADLQEYEKLDPASHNAANALQKELRGKLKATCTRWREAEEIRIFREALDQLNAHKE